MQMTRIVLTDALRNLLPDLSRPIELCDQNGQVVGRFVPEVSVFVGEEPPPLSAEEIKRRLSEPRYTTAEVLAFLESLP
jgi:hypothetical protein